MAAGPDNVISPRFHSKSISTAINLPEGGYALIGSWTPTGDLEGSEKNLRHLVFVTGSLQEE